mgnify:CR=1 FL=1
MAKQLGLGTIKITPKIYISNRKERYTNLFGEWKTSIKETNAKNELKKSFEKHILEMIKNKGSLWETARLKELRMMLDVEKGKKLEQNGQIRYMQIEGNNDNEFKDRPVLPNPTDV